jgi:hypothetical protein
MAETDTLAEKFAAILKEEFFTTFPKELTSYYKHLPSRMPANAIPRRLAPIYDKLTPDECDSVVKDVIDSVLFRMCYLFETGFDERGISVSLHQGTKTEAISEVGLHELYRMRVDPHGVDSDQESG